MLGLLWCIWTYIILYSRLLGGLDYCGAYGRIQFCIADFQVLGLLWCIWTYTILYSRILDVGITVVHMDVYNLVYLLFRCWDYCGAYGRI